jgi:ribosome modulation factor
VLGPRKEILILILALSLLAQAQPPDYHVTADPFHSTYSRSVFLHGHRHGYEDGYHAADQDLHLGRQPQILNPKFHIPKMIGYRSEYGSRASFRHGYDAGYIAGYSDSYTGRQFSHPGEHVATLPAKNTIQPQGQSAVPITDADFDSGVYEGYRSAVADKANFDLHPGLAQYAEDFCHQNLIRGTASGFCSGYGSGFVLGKSDAVRRMRPDSDNVVRVATNQR